MRTVEYISCLEAALMGVRTEKTEAAVSRDRRLDPTVTLGRSLHASFPALRKRPGTEHALIHRGWTGHDASMTPVGGSRGGAITRAAPRGPETSTVGPTPEVGPGLLRAPG